jgi:hypothetical protein
MIVPFPKERATGRNSTIASRLEAAAYCEGKARLAASQGDEFGAYTFAITAMQHRACLPPPCEVVLLTIL